MLSFRVGGFELRFHGATDALDTSALIFPLPASMRHSVSCQSILRLFQSKGKVQIARSRSMPINDKEASLKGMDSFFRVIPSTPRVKEGDVFSNASEAGNSGVHQLDVTGFRVWQEVPVLAIISMLTYFCFLEQLLVEKMGTSAIAISLPFSCIVGLVASTTASTGIIGL